MAGPVPYPNIVNRWAQLTGQAKGLLPDAAVRPATSLVAGPLLGAGIGYGVGSGIGALTAGGDPEAKQRIRRNWAVLGGGLGLAEAGTHAYVAARSGHPLASQWRNETDVPLNQYLAKAAADRSYVIAPVKGPLRRHVRLLGSMIPHGDLHEGRRERNPHVTVMYGLTTKRPERVQEVIQDLGPLSVETGELNLFTKNPKYDVLKVEVHGEQLRRMHHRMREHLKNKRSHGRYKPHVTVAYLKKGRGHKYKSGLLSGRRLSLGHVQLSTRRRGGGGYHTHRINLHKHAALDPVTRCTNEKAALDLNTMSELPPYSPWGAVTAQPATGTTFGSGPHISLAAAANTVLADPTMDPVQKATAFHILAQAGDDQPRGLITPSDLVRGAVNSGLGYAAAGAVGKMMGALFGMREGTQRRLAQMGAVGGLFAGLLR
jgi:hypothetical protein